METYTHSTRSSIVANILVAIAPKNNTEKKEESNNKNKNNKNKKLCLSIPIIQCLFKMSEAIL